MDKSKSTKAAARRLDTGRPHQVTRRLIPILIGPGLSAHERSEQQRVLRQRLVSMSLIVAIGVLAWIPIDLQMLPPEVATRLAAVRAALAACMMGIAWSQHRNSRWLPPIAAIIVFVIVQCAAFAWLEAAVPMDAHPLMRLGYGLFPFIIAAQIAVFPLSLTITLMISLPVIGLVLLPNWHGPFVPELSVVGGLWLSLLIMLIAGWAGTSQLALMRDLLRARVDAAHDGLTGLANRRQALRRLDAEIARAHRHPRALALLALDLDHFKRVNDSHGHPAGDRVLIEFAATLRDALRQGDLGARSGGEEFIALLPDTDRDAAVAVAERIRQQCENLHVHTEDGADIRFTVSIGVATLGSNDNAATLIAHADAALYRAKQSGRNRVVAED